MATLIDPVVGDRKIYGSGTDQTQWLNWSGLTGLPDLNLTQHFPERGRVLIFAPHPDDEILGCAGLMQQLAAAGRELLLVAVTNGTGSHPRSKRYSVEQLNVLRPQESLNALAVLGLEHKVQRIALNIADGQVMQAESELLQQLQNRVQPEDILVTTFAQDGHPDHEATGRVVQHWARQHRQRCYQVLIWAWHWAMPADARIPWAQARKLRLTAQQLALKQQAIQCFKTQIEADDTIHQPPILSAKTISRLLIPYEVYIDATEYG
ncbi:PIG-L deacetylase family protein [Acinetobacter indicus]|uniref:PIG-L deacetylase family protein n=1 Tax=Acinetobacter indicus TaxID=756892 RepID=UPI0014449244|nr:PIG-L deacetylase family protein [Acinetobacter indicus]